MIGALLLMLAGAEPIEVAAVPEPARAQLVCRHETFISRLILRRKMCLTEAEWFERDRNEGEASRRSIYELMGNTACQDGGICTGI